MSNAVIYSRVSTDEEVQIHALESQIKEARQAVELNGWDLVAEYVDEGKSGTTTKQRDGYNRLLLDMESRDFDIIVVKSQDRLMRNTREWYVFVDKLVQSQKKLYFYLEHKFYTPEDALITGIKAILAEEYSRDLSKKINNAHKHRQKAGECVLLTSNTWGYDKVGGEVVINEKEAEIVRLIYDLCIKGYGSRIISKELERRGIQSRSGGKFQEATVRRIIRNPLFKGVAVMNRRHVDFQTKKSIQMPEQEWMVHKNAVPAIVTEEIWQKANASMDSRAAKAKTGEFQNNKRGVNLGRYDLSGKMICGECGSVYWRRQRRNAKGEIIAEWSCSEYVRRGRKNPVTDRGKEKEISMAEGGCDNVHLQESALIDALHKAADELYEDQYKESIDAAMELLETVLEDGGQGERLREKKEQLMKKRESLLDKMLEGVISEELFKRKDISLEAECRDIQSQMSSMKEHEGTRRRIKARREALKNEVLAITSMELNTKKLIEHIEQVVIFPNYADVKFDHFEEMRIQIERKGYQTVMFHVQKIKGRETG